MAQLFTDTLHRINIKDYLSGQIKAWNDKANEARWKYLFESDLIFLLAENQQGDLLGFTSINPKGYLHSMFVHADYQRMGIAGKLLDEVERLMDSKQQFTITSEVSITAYPFFRKRGFVLIKEQEVELDSVILKNYLMEKDILLRG